MKYVGNSYSPAMLTDLDVITIQKELDYDAFRAFSYDAKSVIGHKDIANCFGFEYNPGTIKLNPGDIYYCILSRGGKFPKRFADLEDLTDIEITFVCMQFIKN